MLYIFETYITSFLGYASELCFFYKAPDFEKVNIQFFKRMLVDNTRTSGEIRVFNMHIHSKLL